MTFYSGSKSNANVFAVIPLIYDEIGSVQTLAVRFMFHKVLTCHSTGTQ